MIPHAGAMHLLDGVLFWDADRIRCLSRSHRDRQNPLRMDGRLSALGGIEYAAQPWRTRRAGGNVASRPRMGYLASLREVSCSRARSTIRRRSHRAKPSGSGRGKSRDLRFEVGVGDIEVLPAESAARRRHTRSSDAGAALCDERVTAVFRTGAGKTSISPTPTSKL